ncbi:MAG: 50S ribosomal protein L10 [Clostridia bacterium]|nr:50S ribosomal protein L10 [Clostridia bacterium]MDD4375516.1 50S ribosomal protein L10 [Clostridia bacterium]
MPSAKVLEQKQKQVKEVAEKLAKSKMTVFTEYRGITVEDDMALRKNLREAGCESAVIKNTILKLAAKEANIEVDEEIFKGPTSVIFSYEDIVAPARIANDYAKNHDFYTFKGGIMEQQQVSKEEVIKLAKLPTKETLLTMLASALLGNIRNLAVVINEVSKQKSEETVNA